MITLTIDGQPTSVAEGATILDACRQAGLDTPTLCDVGTLAPVNVCRVCVVEVEGSRALVPSCSRPVSDAMVVRTDTDRVRHSRKLVLELLASSVDLSRAGADVHRWIGEYQCDPTRFGSDAATVAQAPKRHDELFVRDYEHCVLCYQCVAACGEEAQHTFAIAIAGRGFDAHVSTEYDTRLDESACVYCGNCIAVCPTGALVTTPEFDLRAAGEWAPERQSVTTTVCPYCGVGCNLEIHVQDASVVKVTSPGDHDITRGNLCVKGRFLVR